MRIIAALSMATLLACVLPGCDDVMPEPAWPRSGHIVARTLAPDKVAEAVLVASPERGRYSFEIRESGSGDVLAQVEISAPTGYHEHVISLHWPEPRRAETTIDHDFGDNSLNFTLSY